jgi:hypothetical protein
MIVQVRDGIRILVDHERGRLVWFPNTVGFGDILVALRTETREAQQTAREAQERARELLEVIELTSKYQTKPVWDSRIPEEQDDVF